MIYFVTAERRNFYFIGGNKKLPERVYSMTLFPETALTEVELVELARGIVSLHSNFVKPRNEIDVIYSNSEVFFMAFRVEIAKSNLSHKDFKVTFFGEGKTCKLMPNPSGTFNEWPKGFFDTYNDLLDEILFAQIERIKREHT